MKFNLVIRSWKTHQESKTAQHPQDFITINKLAIKMNATNYGTNKDFRKTIDIRQKMRKGGREKKIILPHEDFVYGLPNRPATPIKDVINSAYGNRAEDIIRNEYAAFMREKSVKNRRPPKVVPRFINPKLEQIKKREEEKKKGALDYIDPLDAMPDFDKKNEKPLYKLKMFQNFGSKVTEAIKQFKTYHPYKKHQFDKTDDGLDHLINKVQGEIKQKEDLNNQNPLSQQPISQQQPIAES